VSLSETGANAHDARSAAMALVGGEGLALAFACEAFFCRFRFQAGGREKEREAWMWYGARCFVGAEWVCMGTGCPSRGSLGFFVSLLLFFAFYCADIVLLKHVLERQHSPS
jgi:hypothetical protein